MTKLVRYHKYKFTEGQYRKNLQLHRNLQISLMMPMLLDEAFKSIDLLNPMDSVTMKYATVHFIPSAKSKSLCA